MLPTNYDTGKIIYDALNRISRLENITGLRGNLSNVILNDITIKSSLTTNFLPPYGTLFADINNNIIAPHISSHIQGNTNQTTTNDVGFGKVQIGTVQDISSISSPTFNKEKIVTSMQLSPINYTTVSSYAFELLKENKNDSTLCISKFGNDIISPKLILKKSRNTLTSPENVSQNDTLGALYFSSYDGSSFVTPSLIEGYADTIGGGIRFYTTRDGTTNLFESIQINEKGCVRIYSTTDTNILGSGALIVDGSTYIHNNLNINEDLTVSGVYDSSKLELDGTFDSTSTSTGTLVIRGGVGILGSLYVGGSVKMLCTYETTSSSTGSLIIDGGVGINGNLFVNGSLNTPEDKIVTSQYILTGTDTSTSETTGTVTVVGGVGVAKHFNVGGNIMINNADVVDYDITRTSDSTSTSTGVLTVLGGMGVMKTMSVGQNITLGTSDTDWNNTFLKFSSGYQNGNSYVYAGATSLNMYFNGRYDDSMIFTNNDASLISSGITCDDGHIMLSLSMFAGQEPKKSIIIDNIGNLQLYNATNNDVYANLCTDANGYLSVISPNKQITLGNNVAEGYRIKFPSNVATHSYIYTGITGMNMSFNGYYDGVWNDQNLLYKTSSISQYSGNISMSISRTNGSQALPAMIFSKEYNIGLYDNLSSKIVGLYAETDGALSIFPTGYTPTNSQIKIGTITNNVKIQLPTGSQVGTGIPPGGYLYTYNECMSCSQNGYWNGSQWVCDSGKTSTCIEAKDGEVNLCIGTNDGVRPRKTMEFNSNGETKLYYQNATYGDDTKSASFATDINGNLSIQTSNGKIIFNETNKISLLNTNSYSLQTLGGSGINGNLNINGILQVNGSIGRTINPLLNENTFNHSIMLWDNITSPLDAYISVGLYDISGNGKGISINGGGWTTYDYYGLDVIPPISCKNMFTQKYDASTTATYTVASDGSLMINTSGNSVTLYDTVKIQNISINSLIVGGDTYVETKLFAGGYSNNLPYLPTTKLYGLRDMLLWCQTSTTPTYDNTLIKLQDLNVYGSQQSRTLSISNNIFIESSLNTSSCVNRFPDVGKWFIIVPGGSNSPQTYPFTITVKSPNGQVSELIIPSGNTGEIYSSESNFNSASCRLIVCHRYASSNFLGNAVFPQGWDLINTSSTVTQSFTMVGYSYVSEIQLYMFQTYGADFYVNVSIYQGDGVTGTLKSNTSVLCPNSSTSISTSVFAVLPGSILLDDGQIYTIAISSVSSKTFYIGYTNTFSTSYKINNITQPNKLLSYLVYYSNTSLNFTVLAKPGSFGQTYEINSGNSQLQTTMTNTHSSLVYASTILYDSFNPPITGRRKIYSENVNITPTINSSSSSTGTLIVFGGIGIGNNTTVNEICYVLGTADSTSVLTGSVRVNGGIGCSGAISCIKLNCNDISQIGGYLQINDATDYGRIRYTTTDGLILGPSSSGQILTDTSILMRIQNTWDTASSNTGSIIISGGIGITKRYCTGINSSVSSTSTSTGSLIVNGGMGIAKNLYVQTDINTKGYSVVGLFNYSKVSYGIKGDLFNFSVISVGDSSDGWHSCAYSPQLGQYAMTQWQGISNAVMISNNGINWRLISVGQIFWFITWVPELFLYIAVGPNATKNIIVSSDGENWVTRNPTTSGRWRCVCWSRKQNKLVCVGIFGSVRCIVSSNAITWTNGTINPSYEWWGVCYSEKLDLFVAVSYDRGIIAYSANGTTWSYTDVRNKGGYLSPLDNDFSSCWIEWSPDLGMFVTLINSTSVGEQGVLYSQDGINWIFVKFLFALPFAFEWRCIRWIADYHMFIASGYYLDSPLRNGFMYSYNGINWNYLSTPNETTQGSVACIYSPALRQIIVTQSQGILLINPISEKFIAPYTVNSSSISTGGLISFGGCGISKNMTIYGNTNVTYTLDSTSYTSGSLIINGGVGISNALNLTGGIYASGPSVTCGSLTLGGNSVTYKYGSKVGSWTGPCIIASGNVKYEKFGNVVKLTTDYIEGSSTNNTSIFTFSTTIDAGFYNINSQTYVPVYIKNGGSYAYGTLNITTSGQLYIWAGMLATNYFSLGVCGFQINNSYIV